MKQYIRELEEARDVLTAAIQGLKDIKIAKTLAEEIEAVYTDFEAFSTAYDTWVPDMGLTDEQVQGLVDSLEAHVGHELKSMRISVEEIYQRLLETRA
jgi:hypothetical protein